MISMIEAFEYFDEIQQYDDLELLTKDEKLRLEEFDNRY